MATTTYEPIQTYTLGISQSSVTFSSISGYTDLVLVANPIITGGTAYNLQGWFNSDNSGTSYSATRLNGVGSGSGSSDSVPNYPTLLFSGAVKVQTTYGSQFIIQIQNYANTSTYKTVLCRSSNASTGLDAIVNTWRSTAAVTSFSVRPEVSTFAAGSTFTLYGIANAAIGAPKATGGTITYDNTYYYHTFGASGTFTPQQSLTADILVVAGGGAGTGTAAAGGGAGGVVYNSSVSLANATAYTCTVGAGASYTATTKSNGGNSNITGGSLSLTAAVGGGSGGIRISGQASGNSGGSGGGGAGSSSSYGTNTGGSQTTGQGYAGGAGSSSVISHGGGGGAGGAGTNADTLSLYYGGAGGVGTSTYSSWGLVAGVGQNVSGTVYFAGGGGGGSGGQGGLTPGGIGGYGGGGNGGFGTNTGGTAGSGVAGLPNTGGGGGGGGQMSGAGSDGPGSNGGSGVVIIRYLKA
jgi:hypothetical protein